MTHVGVAPFHDLSAWHVTDDNPVSVYPASHEKYALLSYSVSSVAWSTAPFVGGVIVPQSVIVIWESFI